MATKKKILITVTGVVLILLTIIYLIIIPTNKQIRNLHNAIVSEEKELELKLKKGMLIKKINEDFLKIKSDREKLYSMFIPSGLEIKFLETLENIIKSYNLTQDIVPIKLGDKTKVLLLKISVNGDFVQIIQYLNQIEKINYYFNINKINVETKNSEIGTANAIFEGEIYSLN